MTYFMKVLAAIAQFFIFVNAMKGECRCLSALQLMNIYRKKRGKESSGKNLMLTWDLFCFRIPTLYLFFRRLWQSVWILKRNESVVQLLRR